MSTKTKRFNMSHSSSFTSPLKTAGTLVKPNVGRGGPRKKAEIVVVAVVGMPRQQQQGPHFAEHLMESIVSRSDTMRSLGQIGDFDTHHTKFTFHQNGSPTPQNGSSTPLSSYISIMTSHMLNPSTPVLFGAYLLSAASQPLMLAFLWLVTSPDRFFCGLRHRTNE